MEIFSEFLGNALKMINGVILGKAWEIFPRYTVSVIRY